MSTSKNSLNTELKTTDRKTKIAMKRSKIQIKVFNLLELKFMLFKNNRNYEKFIFEKI